MNTKFHVKSTMSVMMQLASALTYLHERDIIHGNVKLSNIIVTSDKYTVVLRDPTFPLELKVKTTKVFTEHLAPEISLKTPELTKASDVWSLGVVMSQLMTPTLRGGLRRDIQMKGEEKVHDNLRKQMTKGNEYPKELIELVIALLHFEPEKRPTLLQVIQELTSIQKEYQKNVQEHETQRIFLKIKNDGGDEITKTYAENFVSLLSTCDDDAKLTEVLITLQGVLLGEQGEKMSEFLSQMQTFRALERLTRNPKVAQLVLSIFGDILFMDKRFMSKKQCIETRMALEFLFENVLSADPTCQLACAALQGWKSRYFTDPDVCASIIACPSWYLWFLSFLPPAIETKYASDMQAIVISIVSSLTYFGLSNQKEGFSIIVDEMTFYLQRISQRGIIKDQVRCTVTFEILSQVLDMYLNAITKGSFEPSNDVTDFKNMVLFFANIEEFMLENATLRPILAMKILQIISKLRQEHQFQYPKEITDQCEDRLIDIGLRQTYLRMIKYTIGTDLNVLEHLIKIVRFDFFELYSTANDSSVFGSNTPEPFDPASTLLWIVALLFQELEVACKKEDFVRASTLIATICGEILEVKLARQQLRDTLKTKSGATFLVESSPLLHSKVALVTEIATLLQTPNWRYIWLNHLSPQLDAVCDIETRARDKIRKYGETLTIKMLRNVHTREVWHVQELVMRLDAKRLY